MCLRCEALDHFPDECDDEIRVGNPRFNKAASTLQEALVQFAEFCGTEDHVKAFHSDVLQALLASRPTAMNQAIQDRDTLKALCLRIFRALQKLGLHQGMFPP